MKHTRLIPIIIVAMMLFNCILPVMTVNATNANMITIELYENPELYFALEEQLKNVANCNGIKRTITISENEILKITSLDLSEKGISDLEGLNVFTNLKELDLSSNKLNSESNLSVLSSLNLTRLDLSTNNIEDVSSIENLDSISELNLHSQNFTMTQVIVADEEGVENLEIDLPQILSKAGGINHDQIILNRSSYPGNNTNLKLECCGDSPKVRLIIGDIDDNGKYSIHKGLMKLDIEVKESTNALSKSKITLYYLVIDSTERAAIFKDANLYNSVKKQLTNGTNDFNEDLRTYTDGENGETLYKNAYDDAMLMVFDLNTLINEIPSLELSNLGIEDLSGIETFVGLEKKLDVSYNKINSIKKIIELQENKNLEEEALQGRFKEQVYKINSIRTRLVDYISQIDEISEQISAAIAEADEKIAKLDASASDFESKKTAIEAERDNKLNTHVENGKEVVGLNEKKEILIIKADEELEKLKSALEALYEIYNKEYKATTLLTLELNNITKDEFKKLNKDSAKRLFDDQVAKIAKLESSKSLADTELHWIEEKLCEMFKVNSIPKTDEDGEIENPVSTFISKMISENSEFWNADNYREFIAKFIEMDAYCQIVNYTSICAKYESWDIDDRVEFIIKVMEYCTNVLEENPDRKICQYFEEINEEADFIYSGAGSFFEDSDFEKMYMHMRINNLNIDTVDCEYEQVSTLSYILGLSGKFVNLTEDEIKAYITLPDLKTLNLSDNLINNIDGIEIYTELKELYVANNEISNINNVKWEDITKLSVLDASKNLISDIEVLETLKNLKELYVRENRLSGEFLFDVLNLEKLEIADFSYNQYSDLSDFINALKCLAFNTEDGISVSEYFEKHFKPEILFYNQYLKTDPIKFVATNLEENHIETIQMPAIFKQFKILEPTKTIYDRKNPTDNNIKVRNDGTIGLLVEEEGKFSGDIVVLTKYDYEHQDEYQEVSMGHGTTCTISYEVVKEVVNEEDNTENTPGDTTGDNTENTPGDTTGDNTENTPGDTTGDNTETEIKKPVKDNAVFEQTPNATVDAFVKGLVDGEHTVKVFKDGVEVPTTSKLATGMKVKIGNDTEYTVVVLGDVNGDGIINSSDSTAVKEHRGETEALIDANLKAADVNNDGNVNRIDSFLILCYRAEKISDFSEETIASIMK